jgi:hypothetical protein
MATTRNGKVRRLASPPYVEVEGRRFARGYVSRLTESEQGRYRDWLRYREEVDAQVAVNANLADTVKSRLAPMLDLDLVPVDDQRKLAEDLAEFLLDLHASQAYLEEALFVFFGRHELREQSEALRRKITKAAAFRPGDGEYEAAQRAEGVLQRKLADTGGRAKAVPTAKPKKPNRAWKAAALEAIKLTCEQRETFISDDVWTVSGLVEPDDSRALGAQFGKARELGYCEKTGEMRPSVRSRGSGKPVWRSLIFRSQAPL